MSSDSSLLGGMPPRPTLRSSTSAPIMSVMIRRSRQATVSMPLNTWPYQRERVSMVAACSEFALPLPAGERVGGEGRSDSRSYERPSPGSLRSPPSPLREEGKHYLAFENSSFSL